MLSDMPKNPCNFCDKANMDFVNDLEYGCDDPCQKAENYFAEIGKKIDYFINLAEEALKGGEEECGGKKGRKEL